ncbi:MAG: Kdo hydroxylase family protein, partial [Caulobacteraceae bacterium]|nr:Kdo hydroxylase family protein [Caulobacteraceae bacterium]
MAPGPSAAVVDRADALERGEVLFLPDRPFRLNPDEASLLSPQVSDGRAKTISFDPATGDVGGAAPSDQERLRGLLARYAAWAQA